MSIAEREQCYFPKPRISSLKEHRHVHQHNKNAVRLVKSIGDLAGLTDMGLHMVRIEPGFETTEFHFHGQDEEFVYIISGQGTALLGNDTIIVAPGDVMLFPKNGPAHAMRNEGPEDLVYLMGGTRSEIDVCTYPRLQLRQYRINGAREYTDIASIKKVDP
ncbi:MAG: cupin domain-containing protein [Parvibaculum sp.]